MTHAELTQKLAGIEGTVTLHAGWLWFPDGDSIELKTLTINDPMPEALIDGTEITCTNCGSHEFDEYEDLLNYRKVHGIAKETLYLSEFTKLNPDGDHARLVCQDCYTDHNYPKIDVEYGDLPRGEK